MLVRAVRRGFFGGQFRRRGDEFDCPSDSVSKVWMEPIKKGKNKPLKEPKDGYIPLEIPTLMDKASK